MELLGVKEIEQDGGRFVARGSKLYRTMNRYQGVVVNYSALCILCW